MTRQLDIKVRFNDSCFLTVYDNEYPIAHYETEDYNNVTNNVGQLEEDIKKEIENILEAQGAEAGHIRYAEMLECVIKKCIKVRTYCPSIFAVITDKEIDYDMGPEEFINISSANKIIQVQKGLVSFSIDGYPYQVIAFASYYDKINKVDDVFPVVLFSGVSDGVVCEVGVDSSAYKSQNGYNYFDKPFIYNRKIPYFDAYVLALRYISTAEDTLEHFFERIKFLGLRVDKPLCLLEKKSAQK